MKQAVNNWLSAAQAEEKTRMEARKVRLGRTEDCERGLGRVGGCLRRSGRMEDSKERDEDGGSL
jgi:hypothetical protein